jgi:membrane dipeptidase
VAPTDRNRKDAEITGLVEKGGMIGLCGLPRSIAETDPSIEHMLDHADHVRRLVGAAHLGLGLDLMEGFRANKTTNPALIRRRTLRPDIFGTMDDFWNDDLARGFNSIAHLPDLVQGLLDRGWPRDEVEGVFGRNWLRCFAALSG